MLESVVITKFPKGYTATVRCKDHKFDKIFSSYTKEDIQSGFGIYQQVENYVKKNGLV